MPLCWAQAVQPYLVALPSTSARPLPGPGSQHSHPQPGPQSLLDDLLWRAGARQPPFFSFPCRPEGRILCRRAGTSLPRPSDSVWGHRALQYEWGLPWSLQMTGPKHFSCLDATEGLWRERDKELWLISSSPSWGQRMQYSPTFPSTPPAPVWVQPGFHPDSLPRPLSYPETSRSARAAGWEEGKEGGRGIQGLGC